MAAFRRIKDLGFLNKKFDGFNDEKTVAEKYMNDASKDDLDKKTGDEVYMDDDGKYEYGYLKGPAVSLILSFHWFISTSSLA